jgi:hypothetical protein
MDPYLERPEIWPDFHDRLITCISGFLQPLLRPKYLAIVQDRLYLTQPRIGLYPDVTVIRRDPPNSGADATTATAVQVDRPLVFERLREKFREPLIHIVEAADASRVVTAIEVLSPANKRRGQGRKSFLQKRKILLNSDASFVEIDLLRDGRPTTKLSASETAHLGPCHYRVVVLRNDPERDEIYPIPLGRRLPVVGIPLADGDSDVPLDLQAAFTRCWEEGPYPEILRYHLPPPGTMSEQDLAWCEGRLREAGVRS